VWDEAARWLNKFPEAVLTATDRDGYPVSYRVSTSTYNKASGHLPVSPPPGPVDVVDGPASLLCHSHDEKLWNLKMIMVTGTFESRDDGWLFRTESFKPPSKLAVLDFVRSLRRSAQKYLDKRGLERPQVNWSAIDQIKRRAGGG
jgi:hypothetical protein